MTTKAEVSIAISALLVAFALGRYTTPVKIVTEVKTVEVDKKSVDTNKDTAKHEKKTITETDKPDGTKTITTIITQDTDQKTNSTETDQVSKATDSTKEVIKGGSKTAVYGMAGLSLSSLSVPLYGGGISKEVLGPITVGAWGLTNGTAGVSVGISF